MSRTVHHDRIALAIQQPWAELIVRGVKTVEIRSTTARVREPIYVYASRRPSVLPDAAVAAKRFGFDLDALPRGVIVGMARLADCRPATTEDADAACVGPDVLTGRTAWRFTDPVKFDEPLAVRFPPYGIWFYPFRRK